MKLNQHKSKGKNREEQKQSQHYNHHFETSWSLGLSSLHALEELLITDFRQVLLQLLWQWRTIPFLLEVGFVVDLLSEVSHLCDILPVVNTLLSLLRLLAWGKDVFASKAGYFSVPVEAEFKRYRLDNLPANGLVSSFRHLIVSHLDKQHCCLQKNRSGFKNYSESEWLASHQILTQEKRLPFLHVITLMLS